MIKMAVVKVNYVKRGMGEKKHAKETIRYIQHRKGKEGANITRTLFNNDGALGRHQAYRMIDEAREGNIFYRFIISPDQKKEDTGRDLFLREITAKTIMSLENSFNSSLQWAAAVHDDHTDKRHVHVLAVLPTLLNVRDLTMLRQAATEACLFQRRERDLALEHTREREEEEWEQHLS
jgi:hypothetical protein